MVRDDKKLVVVQGATTKPVVRIFTAAGEALAAFVWDHGRIAGMGWSNQEDLLIVDDHGEVRFRICRLMLPCAWLGWHDGLINSRRASTNQFVAQAEHAVL